MVRKTVLLLGAAMLAGCAASGSAPMTEETDMASAAQTGAQSGYDLAAMRGAIAPVEMNPDTSFLNAEERQVVNLLIDAAEMMREIYLRQAYARNPEVRVAIAASGDTQALAMFDLHMGPWDTLNEKHPFWGAAPAPEGAGFYPEDLTRQELDAYLAAHPNQKDSILNGYTVVRRQGERLVAVPYSEAYAEWLRPAAAKLKEAAAITSNASLKRFLTLRADAFLSNDYYESELAWMDVSGTPIEMVIGPYEVYTDELYGQKTAFEAFVTLQNPEEAAKLSHYKALLKDMEANLPVADGYKNFERDFNSPILVAEQVHGGGDNERGVQTIAFNLPNDERVREAKGAKKVILENVLGAKYDRILVPLAKLVLQPQAAAQVSKQYMTLFTLFHELAHSLGPGTIMVDGRETTVGAELKEVYSASEEAKADIMGMWNLLYMMERGELPAAEQSELLATYAAGLFRGMRFGIDEAHGRGAALQYRWMRDKGALVWDERAGRFRVDEEKMVAAIESLTARIVTLQGDGDYAGMKAFFEDTARLDGPARTVIASMDSVPIDIQPIYPDQI